MNYKLIIKSWFILLYFSWFLSIATLGVIVLVACSELAYKDEICYDKCLQQNMYVKVDTKDECVCTKLEDN